MHPDGLFNSRDLLRIGSLSAAATIDAALGIHHRAIVHNLLDRPLPVLDHGESVPEILRPSVSAKCPPKDCVSRWSRYCRSSAAKECLHLGRLSTSEVIRHGHCPCC
jgi:hypothetical protein